MNLIGNCCISSNLLRKWGFGNTNPFSWVELDFDSFYNLLTDYENINWEDIKLSHRPHPYTEGQVVFELTIDNRVKLTFIHMLYDAHAKKPIVHIADVYYCRIWEYIIQKYFERLQIMLESNKEPIFVTEWEHLNFDEAAFKKLLNTDLKYKVIVITYNTKFKYIKKNNLLVIYDPHGRGWGYAGAGNRFPDWFANTYSEKIKQFVYT